VAGDRRLGLRSRRGPDALLWPAALVTVLPWPAAPTSPIHFSGSSSSDLLDVAGRLTRLQLSMGSFSALAARLDFTHGRAFEVET